MKNTVTTQYMNSLFTLLRGVIDYAGLFPPAKLDMASAVSNYAEYLKGEYSWALGRFIVPVGRLEEFETHANSLLPRQGKEVWRISVLAGADASSEIQTVRFFNQRHQLGSNEGNAVIDAVEAKAANVPEIEAMAKAVGADVQLYVETPINTDPSELIGAMKRTGVKAKVRTGGATSDAFPTSNDLARFIMVCASHGVEFKATAGLHHPLRSAYPLTYEAGSPTGTMYGFLNVFLASALARKASPLETVRQLLEEQDYRAFAFDDDAIVWRKYRLDLEELRSTRTGLAHSFGSCSFTEPIDDLNTLGLL